MDGLKPGHWTLILVHILLLQLQPGNVEAGESLHQKLRQKFQRFTEQFQNFQALTQARLDTLVLNHERNFTGKLDNQVQTLTDQYHHLSQELSHIKKNTTQELEGLRQRSKKLEKKNIRLEDCQTWMERNLRETRRHIQKQKPDLNLSLSNLTVKAQSQEERLAALQTQHDSLLSGLKELQQSLKNQELRMAQLEGKLGEVLRWKESGATQGPRRTGNLMDFNITPEEPYASPGRSQVHKGRISGRILDGTTQSHPEGAPTFTHLQVIFQNQTLHQPFQHQETPNQDKHLKAQNKSRLQSEFQVKYPNYKSQSINFRQHPQPDPFQTLKPQHSSQIQPQPYLTKHEHNPQFQLQSHHRIQVQPHFQDPNFLLSPAQTNPKSTKDRNINTKPGDSQPQGSGILPQAQSESYLLGTRGWNGGNVAESEAKSSLIHNVLQLPERHKIPTRPIPKKDATICNVDSMLFFPSASEENYVTFSSSFPNLPELSVCLWLQVEADHVGTLLSYATDDNDNQFVLYGCSSSHSSTALLSPSASFTTPSSSPSLDFVIGDPVFRHLPVVSLLDSRWHHLCILWSSIQGRFWHYTDQRLTSTGSNFQKGQEVPGGGSVVLGQEQDTVGGGFDPAEGFKGQIAGFRVWNRVLSPLEVKGVAQGRGVPRGVVLSMEDIKEVHGEVQQVACECLEHCV
ncbi:uncharacterized protein LOC117527890 [Thalassophryne amazonica]|uniref:uncharacterized protein LOC117527890 n=1 Tax=Thalassophryne amazonica TaxID=390379 RepID=UPI0014712002|nr:uncharacterized protein LOC117527890 [Thalassophryne amazonica]